LPSSLRPFENPIGLPTIDDPIRGNVCQPCVCDRIIGHEQLVGPVGIAVEREEATSISCRYGKLEVEILS
jgi:hypothetical protein